MCIRDSHSAVYEVHNSISSGKENVKISTTTQAPLSLENLDDKKMVRSKGQLEKK